MSKAPPMPSSGAKGADDYVNLGMNCWLAARREWLKVDPRVTKSEVKAKNVDVDDVIERIYSSSGNATLREPLPLCQMIDLLIDFWEADGLYD